MNEYDAIRDYLISEDRNSLKERVQRTEYWETEFGNWRSMLLYGPIPSIELTYQEINYCFIHGQFISCILTSISFLEQNFASFLRIANIEIDEQMGFCQIIKKAFDGGFIDKEDYLALLKLNDQRNSLSHYRSRGDKRHPERQETFKDKPFKEIVEEDAKSAIGIVLSILNKSPFRVSSG